MGLLRIAVEEQRWDLAAHTIILAAARVISKGVPDAGSKRKKKYTKATPKS